MKIEITSNYWPNTPHLREIKLIIDGEIILSKFLDEQEIWDLAKQFRYRDQELMKIANEMG